MQVELKERTLEILKNMSQFTSRVVFKQGNRILQTTEGATLPIMEAFVEEEFPCDFQIYDIDKLIHIAKMMDEPVMEITDSSVELSDRSGRKATIRQADLVTLRGVPNYSRALGLPSLEVTVAVSQTDMKSLLRSSSVVEAPQMAFIGDGSRVRLSTYHLFNKNNDSFSFEVGQSDRKFMMIFDTEMFKLLPHDYEVDLSFKGIGLFRAEDVGYYFGASEKSKYDK